MAKPGKNSITSIGAAAQGKHGALKPPGGKGSPSSAPHPKEPQAFYTRQQLADRWGLSVREVDRFIADGALSPTRFGRAVRISKEEVSSYEAKATVN